MHQYWLDQCYKTLRMISPAKQCSMFFPSVYYYALAIKYTYIIKNWFWQAISVSSVSTHDTLCLRQYWTHTNIIISSISGKLLIFITASAARFCKELDYITWAQHYRLMKVKGCQNISIMCMQDTSNTISTDSCRQS